MKIQRTKNTKIKNTYFDEYHELTDSRTSTKTKSFISPGPDIESSNGIDITASNYTPPSGTDPVSGLPKTSQYPYSIGPQPQREDGKSRLGRAIDLEEQANAMSDGPVKEATLNAAREGQKNAKIQIANEDYEARRGIAEKYARERANQTTAKEQEAEQAIRNINNAGLGKSEAGKEAIDIAKKEISNERESQGRAAEQSYRREEAILDQKRNTKIETYEKEGQTKKLDETKKHFTEYEEMGKTMDSRAVEPKEEFDIAEGHTRKELEAYIKEHPEINGAMNETESNPEDETITFNIETVEDAKNKIKSFITSLGEILEKYTTTFSPYAEMNEELYTEELANTISSIINEFSTQFETLSEDADAYANWLGTAAKEAAQAMKEAEGIAQEGPTREIM